MSQSSSVVTMSLAEEVNEALNISMLIHEINEAIKNYCDTCTRARQSRDEAVYRNAKRYRRILEEMIEEMSAYEEKMKGPYQGKDIVGKYTKEKEEINGKPTWTIDGGNVAIWFVSQIGYWTIGDHQDRGKKHPRSIQRIFIQILLFIFIAQAFQ